MISLWMPPFPSSVLIALLKKEGHSGLARSSVRLRFSVALLPIRVSDPSAPLVLVTFSIEYSLAQCLLGVVWRATSM